MAYYKPNHKHLGQQIIRTLLYRGAQAGPPNSAQPAYGPSVIKYLRSKGISWLVWRFDPEWE
jgi:hypothetical protein